eukprot:1966553-Prymnesium_polylepis.1
MVGGALGRGGARTSRMAAARAPSESRSRKLVGSSRSSCRMTGGERPKAERLQRAESRGPW